MEPRARFHIGLTMAVCLLFIAAGLESLTFAVLARYLPLYVSCAGLALGVFCLATIWRDRRLGRQVAWTNPEESVDDTPVDEGRLIRRQIYFFVWFLGYAVLIGLVGILLASLAFTFAFLRQEARLSWRSAALGAAGGGALLLSVSWLLGLKWPASALSLFA